MLNDIETTELLIAKYLLNNYEFIFLKNNNNIDRLKAELIALGFEHRIIKSNPINYCSNLIKVIDNLPDDQDNCDILIYSKSILNLKSYKPSFKIITENIESDKFDLKKALSWKLYKKQLNEEDYLKDYNFIQRASEIVKIKEVKIKEIVYIVDLRNIIKYYLIKYPLLFKFLKKCKNKIYK